MAPATTSIALEEVGKYLNEPVETIRCTTPIPFGGEGQWHYLPHNKKFDLAPRVERKLVVECDEALRNHSGFMFNPDKAALVIVDMQNYFIHPTYRHHAAGLRAVKPILKVIEKCRKEGIQIIWLNWGIDEETMHGMPPGVQRAFSKSLGWHIGLGAELPNGQGRCLFKGTWNAELFEPLKDVVLPDDLFFDKHQMSGLWSPKEPFHRYLCESGTKTLLFAGVNTDQCVYGTLCDAYAWGWDCILIGDCTGTMTGRGAQELCDYNISTNMGFVTDSVDFCEARLVTTEADDEVNIMLESSVPLLCGSFHDLPHAQHGGYVLV
jgi:phosphatidylethanolamine-binding protein